MDVPKPFKKTAWRERRKPWSFLCPVCKSPRKLPFSPKPTLYHVCQIGLTSLVFTIAFWKSFHIKGIFSFVLFWTVFELFYRWRMRALVPCPHCGFNPYLFMVDKEWAEKEIETYWRKKFEEKGVPFPEKKPLPKS